MSKLNKFLFVCISLLFCSFQSLLANNNLTNWTDGGESFGGKYAYDTNWYDATASEYTISTPEQMGAFAAASAEDTFEGKTVKLAADLDMSKYGWVPIGQAGFKGTFDGCGHTLSNLSYTDVLKISAHGLFHTIDGGEVKNVLVSNSTFSDNGGMSVKVDGVGGIAMVLKGAGKITNCGFSGNIQFWGTQHFLEGNAKSGGIAGVNVDGTIANCFAVNNNPVIPEDTIYGNIAGRSGGTIINCYYLKNDTLPGAVNSHFEQGTQTDVSVKEASAFSSGEVAYLLNTNNATVWSKGQKYPVLANAAQTPVYKLSYPLAMEHGKVSGMEYANVGSEVILTSTVDEGYMIKDLAVTDAKLINYTKFEMPAKDVIVTYTVEAIPTNSIVAFPAEKIAGTSFMAKWNKVAGATDYKITVKKDGKALLSYNALPVGNVTTTMVEGLFPESIYTYTVQSVAGNVASAESKAIEVTTGKIQLEVVSKTKHALNLKWESIEGTDKYITYLTNPFGETVQEKVSENSLEFGGLRADCAYTIVVSALSKTGKVIATSDRFVAVTSSDFGKQLSNSTFEAWEKEGTEAEPVGWNSFMSGDGPLVTFTKNVHMEKSEVVRPGSTGQASVRIWTKAVIGIPANGNLTCGRINSGAMIATDQANHNRTVVGDSEFSQPLQDARPDSLTVWVNYSHRGDSVMNARVSAIIHDSYNFADPSSTVDSLHVFATAQQNYAAIDSLKGGWMRLSIPFDYELKEYDAFYEKMNNSQEWKDSLKVDKFVRPTSADYMLVSFATNSTPGIGHEGDQVIIDDMLLIYNPKLKLVKTDRSDYETGETISVEYTLEGTMSPYNLNAEPNIVYLELSDAAGSFADPIVIAEILSDYSGKLVAELPEGLASGSYKVRIVTTNYPMISNESPINVTSDIATETVNGGIRVYPNPVIDNLHVSGLEEGAAYTIYDMTGRAVRTGNLIGGRTNVSELSNGFYFIQTEAGKVKFIKK